jgi:hypothetical protein
MPGSLRSTVRLSGVSVWSSTLAVNDGGVLALKQMILARTIDPIRIRAKTAGKADFASQSHIVDPAKACTTRRSSSNVVVTPSESVTRQP